jgi:hypothetical protein
VTKPLSVEAIDLGGAQITAGIGFPTAPAPPGSWHICQTDGSWWQFTGSSWALAARSTSSPIPTPIINGELTTLLPGAPFVIENGLAKRADASSVARSAVAGLVIGLIPPTLVGLALFQGQMTLTAVDWALITGEPGGLTPGAKYYAGLSAGTLTTTPPSVAGQSIVEVGSAIDNVSFMITPRAPIRL